MSQRLQNTFQRATSWGTFSSSNQCFPRLISNYKTSNPPPQSFVQQLLYSFCEITINNYLFYFMSDQTIIQMVLLLNLHYNYAYFCVFILLTCSLENHMAIIFTDVKCICQAGKRLQQINVTIKIISFNDLNKGTQFID